MDFRRWNNILAWGVFAIALLVYYLTAPRTIPFWDSPEFIASTYKLQVTHPPGAPLYTMLSRIFVAPFPAGQVAFAANLFSALCGAFTVLFSFWCVTLLGRKILGKEEEFTLPQQLAILCSGVVGALTLAFTHSIWASATEAEVYALSTLFIAITYWAALRWEASGKNTWLVLIFLLLGLSVGVHIMNLAITFPLAMLYVLGRYGLSWKNMTIGFGAGLVLFFLLNNILMQGFLKLAAGMDLWLVNSMSMPLHSGLWLTALLLVTFCGLGLYFTQKKKKHTAYLAIQLLLFFYIGASTYTMVLVRSNAHTATSSYAGDVRRLLGYIQSEQFGFGEKPLLWGKTYAAPLDNKESFVDAPPTYVYNNELGKYEMTNDGKYMTPKYAKEFYQYFSRMYDSDPLSIEGYQRWVHIEGEKIDYVVGGKLEAITKPTFGENLDFFFTYQLGWLNIRYLLQNYVGRQNDYRSVGEVPYGNWISGIPFIDKGRVGPDVFQRERKEAELSRNVYYFLPFILGLLGLFFLFRNSKSDFTITLLFFLAFSAAITIFISQIPVHIIIRDRDYIFLGAYFIFSLWAGLSVLGIYQFVSRYSQRPAVAGGIALFCLIAGPLQMAAKGWNDHNRSHDQFPVQLAKAYLDSCPQNTILFTSGDNTTFPLWYMQEVLGYRTDVRVVNYDLLNLDWYIDQLRTKVNASPTIKMSMSKESYALGKHKLIPFYQKKEIKQYVDAGQAVSFATNPNNTTLWNARQRNYLPTDRFSLPVDTAKLRGGGLYPEDYQAQFVNEVKWEHRKQFYPRADLVMLDILASNNWERPICFSVNSSDSHTLSLKNYLVHHGLVEQLLPMVAKEDRVNDKIVDVNMMYPYLMDTVDFSGLNDEDKYIPYLNKEIATNILRRNYYFLGQALLEAGDTAKAVNVIDRCVAELPDETIEYQQFAFALGKLYYRANLPEKGSDVLFKCLDNLIREIRWYVSFPPPKPVLNIMHVRYKMNNLEQMMAQTAAVDPELLQLKQGEVAQLKLEMQQWDRDYFPGN